MIIASIKRFIKKLRRKKYNGWTIGNGWNSGIKEQTK